MKKINFYKVGFIGKDPDGKPYPRHELACGYLAQGRNGIIYGIERKERGVYRLTEIVSGLSAGEFTGTKDEARNYAETIDIYRVLRNVYAKHYENPAFRASLADRLGEYPGEDFFSILAAGTDEDFSAAYAMAAAKLIQRGKPRKAADV